MSLSNKCCNALGCRSEIEKELKNLRGVLSMISGHLDCIAAARLMSRSFGEPKFDTSVRVGDYCQSGGCIQFVPNQFAADCINSDLDGIVAIKVWRNENA